MGSDKDQTLRSPKFLYFDLGNVLMYFDHRRAASQMALLFGTSVDRMYDVVFTGGMNHALDGGQLTTRQMYDSLCGEFGCQPEYDALCHAGADIFELNYGMNSVLSHLKNGGHRIGVLSNTSELHWNFITRDRYRLFPTIFDTVILSFEHRAMKPEPEIYRLAADKAGVLPEDVFYVDDLPANVEGARAAGFDAVQYTTTAAYLEELRRRGIRINY
ncbi:MAG TPA: HAD family phosphatase [Pirellulales bacterium]|nr:HAD family phosphatase [Pirellulales bacterium]